MLFILLRNPPRFRINFHYSHSNEWVRGYLLRTAFHFHRSPWKVAFPSSIFLISSVLSLPPFPPAHPLPLPDSTWVSPFSVVLVIHRNRRFCFGWLIDEDREKGYVQTQSKKKKCCWWERPKRWRPDRKINSLMPEIRKSLYATNFFFLFLPHPT